MKENKLVIKIRRIGYISVLITFFYYFFLFLFLFNIFLTDIFLITFDSGFLFFLIFLIIFLIVSPLLSRTAFLLLIRHNPSFYSVNEKVELASAVTACSWLADAFLHPISNKIMLQHFPGRDQRQLKKEINHKATEISNSKVTKLRKILGVIFLIVYIALFIFSWMESVGLVLFPWLQILSDTQLFLIGIFFLIFIASFAARNVLINYKRLEKIAERISSPSIPDENV